MPRQRINFLNIGDLVKSVRKDITHLFEKVGIVTDVLESQDGFCDIEVLFSDGDTGWFRDLELKVLKEANLKERSIQ